MKAPRSKKREAKAWATTGMLILPSAAAKRTLPESEHASGVPAFDGSELCCWAGSGCRGHLSACHHASTPSIPNPTPSTTASDRTLTGWISSGGTGAFQTSSGQSTSRTSELNSRLPASKLTPVLETRDVREVESNPCPHHMQGRGSGQVFGEGAARI